MDRDLQTSLVKAALAQDQAALRELVAILTPIIQSRVARQLMVRRASSAPGRDVRQEVEDLCQDVFVTLFAEDGRVLRTWDVERGLSLHNFVGLVAERQVVSILRSGRRSPWKEDPTLTADLDGLSPLPDPEEKAAGREEIGLLFERLQEALSPLGMRLFQLLFIEELEVEEISRRINMKADAIYAWRSRLRRLCGQVLGEIRISLSGRHA